MRESTVVAEWKAEGRAEGIAEGIAQGKRERSAPGAGTEVRCAGSRRPGGGHRGAGRHRCPVAMAHHAPSLRYRAASCGPMPKDFSPRIGVAWRPFKKRNTMVRNRIQHLLQRLFVRADREPDGRAAAFCNLGVAHHQHRRSAHDRKRIRHRPTTLTNTYAIDPNFRIAYAQTWNFTFSTHCRTAW